MKKTYQQPEFTVIQQNQANAKFFVASGDPGLSTPTPNHSQTAVNQYATGSAAANETTDENGAFNF